MSDATQTERIVTLKLPRKLAFLLDMHSYKIAYGGRNGLKSTSFAHALLTLGIHQDLRIGCAREIQHTLAESSHQLLKDSIKALGYGSLYTVTDKRIVSNIRDTQFTFFGLSDITAENVKSYEGLDIVWGDEAQRFRRRSLQLLLPTLFRKPNSEFWGTFNPDVDTDEVYDRFVVNPPPGAKVVKMGYEDAIACGWFSKEQENLRQYDLMHSPKEYPNIWGGEPRTAVVGAIYGSEVAAMVSEGRYRALPYDPRFPVHRIWDLGWNDLMTVIMVQKTHPSAITVVNYLEDNQATYAQMLATMDKLGYRWGTDYLPHDATQHHPTSGTNAVKQLRDLGCTVKVIPRSDPEARIKAARMMFPRLYMDNTKRATPDDRPDQALGAANLMHRLKSYKRNIPKSTNEPTDPMHDIHSHGADALGALAEIVDQIRNEGDTPKITLPGFSNPNPGMGLLG